MVIEIAYAIFNLTLVMSNSSNCLIVEDNLLACILHKIFFYRYFLTFGALEVIKPNKIPPMIRQTCINNQYAIVTNNSILS
jgi:hypothetical protein